MLAWRETGWAVVKRARERLADGVQWQGRSDARGRSGLRERARREGERAGPAWSGQLGCLLGCPGKEEKGKRAGLG